MALILIAAFVALSSLPAHAFNKMSSMDWLRSVRHDMTRELCTPRGYIRTCTTIKASRCQPAVVSALDRCIAKMKLPAKIDPLNDGVERGSQLGQCVGHRLEKTAKRKAALTESMCHVD